jgi:hypothetical protein
MKKKILIFFGLVDEFIWKIGCKNLSEIREPSTLPIFIFLRHALLSRVSGCQAVFWCWQVIGSLKNSVIHYISVFLDVLDGWKSFLCFELSKISKREKVSKFKAPTMIQKTLYITPKINLNESRGFGTCISSLDRISSFVSKFLLFLILYLF